jgi:hypothetical protein
VTGGRIGRVESGGKKREKRVERMPSQPHYPPKRLKDAGCCPFLVLPLYCAFFLFLLFPFFFLCSLFFTRFPYALTKVGEFLFHWQWDRTQTSQGVVLKREKRERKGEERGVKGRGDKEGILGLFWCSSDKGAQKRGVISLWFCILPNNSREQDRENMLFRGSLALQTVFFVCKSDTPIRSGKTRIKRETRSVDHPLCNKKRRGRKGLTSPLPPLLF